MSVTLNLIGFGTLIGIGLIVFAVLLWFCYKLLQRVPLRYVTDASKKEEIDHRATLFTLRLALAIGIGAIIIIGGLLVIALYLFSHI